MSIEITFGDRVVEVSIGDAAAILAAIARLGVRIDDNVIRNQQSVDRDIALGKRIDDDVIRSQQSVDRDDALGARIDGVRAEYLPLAGGRTLTGALGMGGNRLQTVADPADDTDAVNRRTMAAAVQAADGRRADDVNDVRGKFLPLAGGKNLTGALGLGDNRLQGVADAQDGKDGMNRDMTYGRVDPLEGAVARGLIAGFRPGSTVPIAEMMTDPNGFLIEADGIRDFEPQAVFAPDGLVTVPAAEIDLGGGRLFRTIAVQVASPVLATSGNRRKDIVSANPQTGSLSITVGVERAGNAAYWTNPPPAGRIEIGRILRTAAGAFYTPTWRRRTGLHVAQAAADGFWLEAGRAATVRTRSRLMRGLPVRVIGYGDSRIAMGANTAYTQLNTHPNSDAGASPAYLRDTPGYFDTYDNETRARVLDQGRDFGDGHGTIHAREGYTWRTLRAVEAAFGITFDAGPNPAGSSYRNWAVGGTDSGTGFITADPAGNQRANGREPVRLNAMLADIVAGQTLVVLGFGMNEIGSASTYANLVAIAQACLVAGAEVMMISTTRPQGAWNENYRAINAWRLTCRETVRAALDSGTAWVDVSTLVAPEWLPSLGITEAEIADATNTNHEGVNVQTAIGQRAARLLIGG